MREDEGLKILVALVRRYRRFITWLACQWQPICECCPSSFIRLISVLGGVAVRCPLPLIFAPRADDPIAHTPTPFRESAAEENATSYFPLLDRIAGGAFEDAVTEKELYDRFLQVVHEDGHLRTAESLSSFKLSLAIRSPAPRIQAHYQFYNTSVQQSLMAAQDAACPVWVHYEDKQYCSSAMERAQQDVEGEL